MNKRLKTLFLIFILMLFFVYPKEVFAEEDSVKCNMITEYYNDYLDAESELDGLECGQIVNDQSIAKRCNENSTKYTQALTLLYQYNASNPECTTDAIQSVLDEHEDECKDVFNTDLKDLTRNVVLIFYIVAPFLMIIFGSLDFLKIVTMADPQTIKKSRSNFFKRLTAFILVYLTPGVVNLLINSFIPQYNLSTKIYSCNTTKFTYYQKTYTPIYVEKKNSGRNKKNSFSSNTNTITIGGITTEEEAKVLDTELATMLNTRYHWRNSSYQNGPFPKYWSNPYNLLSKFQCTWWANGRASEYLEKNGSKYKKYPTQVGNGGQYYDINKENGWFNYGQTPKPNSIISWKKGSAAGHVAYVEGVSSDGIYISHAGSGKSWFGVQKIPLSGYIWSNYSLNGYIYLDEPN